MLRKNELGNVVETVVFKEHVLIQVSRKVKQCQNGFIRMRCTSQLGIEGYADPQTTSSLRPQRGKKEKRKPNQKRTKKKKKNQQNIPSLARAHHGDRKANAARH
ncbi:hypothetical protein EUGRSUZ_H02690 [Eucalyptus grandis]|uniref:Uncharacterized protein n=2 Tax=Eucalyptus grandis TaxID=71139 RepID=A0ACC3JSC7_EUCGR|nr:hypothetical protein EUGRSUZ_H02690 [Eucalyptus grandis]